MINILVDLCILLYLMDERLGSTGDMFKDHMARQAVARRLFFDLKYGILSRDKLNFLEEYIVFYSDEQKGHSLFERLKNGVILNRNEIFENFAFNIYEEEGNNLYYRVLNNGELNPHELDYLISYLIIKGKSFIRLHSQTGSEFDIRDWGDSINSYKGRILVYCKVLKIMEILDNSCPMGGEIEKLSIEELEEKIRHKTALSVFNEYFKGSNINYDIIENLSKEIQPYYSKEVFDIVVFFYKRKNLAWCLRKIFDKKFNNFQLKLF